MVLTTAQQAALNALTTAKQQEAQAQAAYNAVNPTAAQASQVAQDQATINGYIADKQAALTQSLSESEKAGLYLRNLTDLVAPGAQFTKNLRQQADDLTKQQMQLGQKIRTQRRAFVDQFPQTGTGGYFFHHTADDFALFVFLIGFAVAFYALYRRYISSPSWIGGIVGFLFAWFAVLQIILRFG
jgi:hypothetical protein